ncbi:RodZ family helix-turn-helix domain-containing protein [Tychonema sp. BBK16]|uniref:helix-turn-helix domain-containing protein n=1 Tax=Tychonema sp. BBK16 TaxID=2699888 RepID=UPI001F3DF9B8|nr:helix-turn-helix domain-containing protein [Tychonema sp. BBK16]MCF6372075.1 helix-turn-helix domain-containing protein [Tychonema sp. BBK16]
MALIPDAYFGVTDHTTVEVSQESFRSVLSQIEAELLCSDTYSHALASLQTMLGEAASAAEILIRAVSREAVKLAFQRFPKTQKTELQALQESPTLASSTITSTVITSSALVSSPHMMGEYAGVAELETSQVSVPVFYRRSTNVEENPNTDSDTENTQNSGGDPETPEPDKEPPKNDGQVDSAKPGAAVVQGNSFPGFSFLQKQKKLTKEEALALVIQQRKDCLCELGRELREGREMRSLSIQHLHSLTLVPMHHIESIESGEIDKLPQDVYLRGFIRRIGDAVGLNGNAMADALPKLDSIETHNSYLSDSDSYSGDGFQMNSAHLYIGYTALMAGAVGGVAWLSQQPVVPGQPAPEALVTPPASVAPAQKSETPAPRPGVKKSTTHGGMILGADMSPPEMIFG